LSSDAHRFRLDPGATVSDVAGIIRSGPPAHYPAALAVRRTWYDTFDRRLGARGWRLCRTVSGSSARLSLEDGTVLATSGWADHEPTFTDSLPPGLRDRLAPVLEQRVLLPVVEVSSRETVLSLLDDQDKTVARVTIETRRSVRPRRLELPAVVTVAPLRGYAKEAAAAGGLLAADGRFEPLPADVLAELTDLVGGAEPVPTLDLTFSPEMDSGAAVRAVLIRLLQIFRANLPGTIGDLDSEFLHDLRVAVRRARSVLKLVGDVLPDGPRQSLAEALKWLGDLTTPTRDLDVYLHDLAAPGPAAQASNLDPLRQALRTSRAAARSVLSKGLRSRRTAAIIEEWSRLSDLTDLGRSARRPVGALGAERTTQAYRRVIRDGRRIAADSPPESLHDLRKRAKEFRYVLEIFASLHPADLHREVVGELKKLQDCLGSFQDSQVQSDALSQYATELMTGGGAAADTIMAMGALAGDLDRRQAEARARFQTVFDRFDARSTHRGVRSLVRSMRP
jgi:CHAD domain-containing protein